MICLYICVFLNDMYIYIHIYIYMIHAHTHIPTAMWLCLSTQPMNFLWSITTFELLTMSKNDRTKEWIRQTHFWIGRPWESPLLYLWKPYPIRVTHVKPGFFPVVCYPRKDLGVSRLLEGYGPLISTHYVILSMPCRNICLQVTTHNSTISSYKLLAFVSYNFSSLRER